MTLTGKRLSFLFLLFAFTSTPAFAKVNLALMGIGQYGSRQLMSEDQVLRVTDRAKLSYGGAVNLEFMFNHKWSLEIGGTYVERKSHVPTSVTFGTTLLDAGGNTVTTTWIMPTVAFRVRWDSVFFTFGGYYGIASGDVTTDTTVGSTSVSTTSSYANASLEDTDYGVLTSFGRNLAGEWLRMEFRFLMGLRDASSATDVNLQYRDFQLMLGLVF